MGVGTLPAGNGGRDRVDPIDKLSRQVSWLTGPSKEFGCNLPRNRAIFLDQIERKLPLPSPEHHPRRNAGPCAFLLRAQFMPGNQQFVRMFDAECLDAHQRRRNHDGVIAVSRKGVRAYKPRQSFTAVATEGHVMAEFLDRSARFTASQDVPFASLLEFDRDARTTEDPGFTKALDGSRRKR
jgi:hypothetical protein